MPAVRFSQGRGSEGGGKNEGALGMPPPPSLFPASLAPPSLPRLRRPRRLQQLYSFPVSYFIALFTPTDKAGRRRGRGEGGGGGNSGRRPGMSGGFDGNYSP